jgi:hypothetical protein
MKKISGPNENGLSTYEWINGYTLTIKDFELNKEHYERLFGNNKSLRSNDNHPNSIDVAKTDSYDKT